MMASEPAVPFPVVALADYAARNLNELSLVAGQTYTVLQTDGQGIWWQGKSLSGSLAWFPASYTKYLPPLPPSTPLVIVARVTQPTLAPPLSANTSVPTKVPSPKGPPLIEKKPTPVFVKLQIVEAKGLNNDNVDPTAFVFRNNVLGVGPGTQIGHTSTVKRTAKPHWNEAFQINVYDAETEIISIRICHGKKFKPKGSDFLGEVHFPLRSTARDFDSPNYQLRWYPLQGANSGSILVFIQYSDTRQSQGPTNFKHESHLGWNADGSYDVTNIPQAWKTIFTRVGITRKDLSNNSQFAQNVVQIMNNYSNTQPIVPTSSSTSVSFGSLQGASPYSASSYSSQNYDSNSYPQYPQSTPSSSVSLPPPVPRRHSIITSTSVTTFGGPSTQTETTIQYETTIQVENIPPPPPPPPKSELGAGQSQGLLAEIRSVPSLRPVKPTPIAPPRNVATERSLEIILREAMTCIRHDVSGYQNDFGEDADWD